MSGELSGEDELDSGLDFPGREGSSLVESDELGSLGGDSVEGIVDEGVHDVHGLLGDTDVGVDLLEDLVDVDGEGLNSSSSGLLVSSGSSGFSWLLSHLIKFLIPRSSFDQDLNYNKSHTSIIINLIGSPLT